jgi:hypothetical protein
MSQFDIANVSLSVRDEKTGTSGSVDNADFARVLDGFFTPKDANILEEKGFPTPCLKERALWSAYGLFNELDCLVSGDKSNVMTVKLVRLLDSFIATNGGWEYFEKDENK